MFEAVEHSPLSRRSKLSPFSSCKETPPDTMVEEKEALVISPYGGDPFHKTTHFLKPILPSSIDEPFFKLTDSFSSLPSHFDPTKWNLKVEFSGWQHGQKEWKACVDGLAPLYQSTWKEAGIHEAILNLTDHIRRNTDLVHGVAEKWCSEINDFIVPWGKPTITLEDIMVLGDFIFSPLQTRQVKEIEDRLNQVRVETPRRHWHKAKWFIKFVNSGSEFVHGKFLACWISRYVFPSNAKFRYVLLIAILLARGPKIALAPAALPCICKDSSLLKSAFVDLSKPKTGDDTLELNLKSPLHSVQVWAYERVLELRPEANVINFAEPRLAQWDKLNGLNVEDLRRVLDFAGEGFRWRPYAMAIKNWNFPKYYSEKEMWVGPGLDDEFMSFGLCLTVTKVDGFGITEKYLPHGVARQFGFDDDIPCSVAQSSHYSDTLYGKQDPHIAWEYYIKEIQNVKLSIASSLSEADMSTRCLKWWKETLSARCNSVEPLKISNYPLEEPENSMSTEINVHPRNQCSSFILTNNLLSCRLKGTTTVAFIGEDFIHLATDHRGSLVNLPRYVATDNLEKFFAIAPDILATIAGDHHRCSEFLATARDVVHIAFHGFLSPHRVLLAATVVMAAIDSWETRNPGNICREEMIIAGWPNGSVPEVYTIRSKQAEFWAGIHLGIVPGYGTATGSGTTLALDFIDEFEWQHHSDLEYNQAVELAIVAAAVKQHSTGGHVHSAIIRRGGRFTIGYPAASVLHVLDRDFQLLARLLSKSLFFVCRNFNYNAFNEALLIEFLRIRFPHSHCHVISRKNEIIRIINFEDVFSASQAWEQVRHEGLHWVGTVSLHFFEPNSQVITGLLQQEAQGV